MHPSIKYGEDTVIDIFRKVAPLPKILSDSVGLMRYDIEDGDTPELLAYKLYGSVEYHWVLLLVNNIINVGEDWPKSVREFNEYVYEKYGSVALADATHHYEDDDGDVLSVVTNYPVSNYTYEERKNNDKASILILKPEYLEDFVEEYKVLI